MKYIFRLLLISAIFPASSFAQYADPAGADTSDMRIKVAMQFLTGYLKDFDKRSVPDFSKYWSRADLQSKKIPDDMVYAITDDYPTYQFCKRPTIFFARPYRGTIQLKTLFSYADSNGKVMPWAITNHYVVEEDNELRFISELALHKDKYKTIRKRNITYHFPVTHKFSKKRSKAMLRKLEEIEHQWNFAPVAAHYYFASNATDLAAMRGMDYNFAMDNIHPSGISYPAQQTIFCQGLGEGYLHEVLHLYFNPQYGKSPLCHGLIYYLSGSVGNDFDWYIARMNQYLDKYPETDLSQFETLATKDRMLQIDNIVKALLCKMIDEKDGIPGLQRALSYKTMDELLLREFEIQQKDADAFLKLQFRQFAAVKH